jgi:hypothetical protein
MGIYDAAKDVANVLKEAGKIEEYQKILDLMGRLLEMQEKITELEKENKKLKEEFEIKGKLEYKNNTYWLGAEGPYCSRCWEKNRDLLRMHHGPNDFYAHCPECKASVNFIGREPNFPTEY